ncbi:nuclear protein localization protein 4 Ecym_7082 [Eremothecium cymbalariae DBVPG|uniref:Nuclear protein localization protein 4 n=1 Tax=Eremothecium cymbalariae (strain CBS 270.75 / DBVPG 7215 / KCTC 17166 / NRRL Y-17582) TaxID=931890 RepID=G8JVS0_ERECY|nr:hypothetical protein Ecym_7082 [Eremothecium cymbalariae DBVPG\
MLIRFRSKSGTHRVECQESDLVGDIIRKWIDIVRVAVDLASISIATADNPRSNTPVTKLAGETVSSLALKHGDMLTVTYKEASDSAPVQFGVQREVKVKVKELAVDEELEKEEGLIQRKRSRLCRHGDKGMCEYCSPLPPWDRSYQQENSTKHISFHAYVRELNEHTNKASGSSYIPPLSQPDFHVNKNCPAGHVPWPRSICSKCQPSAISLQRQEFRMVDHVEFQHSELVNEFIDSWRTTGMQRFGYLYGTYSKYTNTPLGIKAVVEAIWEPPQHDEQDGLTMDIEQVALEVGHVDNLASEMGLMRVGMIFTDLTDSGNGDGTVFCKRHKDSFFLSSLEVIMAAKHQLNAPNACRFSQQSRFSSKFFTCVVSGNLEGEIDISAYQVSTDAEALVDSDIISGSTHPSMAYINETTHNRYVPDIFYMRKNEYNITVKENAKPAFPVDYLIVSLTHGFPVPSASNAPKFHRHTGFPWTNRQALGQSQDYLELKRYILPTANSSDLFKLQQQLSNFHLLLYIHSLHILNSKEWSLLLAATTCTPSTEPFTEPHPAIHEFVVSPGWQTLLLLLQEAA